MATSAEIQKHSHKAFQQVREYPLLGSLPAYNTDRLKLLRRLAQAGDATEIHFGPFLGILFNKPEHVQSILVEHAYDFDKGEPFHKAVRPLAGNGVFISEGDFHRRQRKLLSPPFQPGHISSYAEIIGYFGEQIQQTWAEGSVIDVGQKMTDLFLSSIGKVLFDADIFSETDDLRAALIQFFDHVSHRLSVLFPLPYSWPTPRNFHTRKAMQFLRARIQRFIDERRSTITERNDFLSLLLEARDEEGYPMSDGQVMAECLTLFGSGHETTATALTWTWYLLCQHPDVYQRVQQEVDRVLQGRTPTYEDLARLPYCLQVFKETMRIRPPVYLFSRHALRDVEIDGYQVPKESIVLISPYTLHRREEYFPNPEQFDPERFTSEREKQLPRHAYLPFGAGPRVCLGSPFALMESHLLLATLVQRVRFALIPGQTAVPDPEHHLTLQPRDKIYVTVQRR